MLFALLLCAAVAAQGREVYPLNDGWRFFFRTENDSGNARIVSLPHSWNTDPMAGRNFIETTGNYLNEIYVPTSWADKRLFVKCYGAQSVADLFVNGASAGEHRGGGTAFVMEITDRVRFGENNTLQFVVSNAIRTDVLPVSTDMNLYGGLYRGVELIVTDRQAVSPLYYGSDGVLVFAEEVSDIEVKGHIDVHLLTDPKTGHEADLELEIRSADNKTVYTRTQRLNGRSLPEVVQVPFAFRYPRLWSPEQPNRYRVVVRLKGATCDDTVEVLTGFRKLSIDSETGWLALNGKPQRLRGVVLYHDNAEGGVIKAEQYDNDLAIVQDMGATAVRSAVMPHAQHFYNRCDERGLLVWIDMPLHRAPYLGEMAFFSTPLFEQNALDQLHETIAQNQNHPSVILWGLFSRLIASHDETMLAFLKQYNQTAHRLDPTRKTVACSDQDGEINFITDLIVWRQTVGWQHGVADDLTMWRDQLATDWSHLHSAISYGGEGFLGITQRRMYTTREQELLSEDRQARFHEEYTRQLATDSLFWGTWVENLFEYGAARRPYALDGHGLISLNRQEKKDAFHLYRALWNPAHPTLRLTGRRQRFKLDEQQHFTIYSSVGRPTLYVGEEGDTVALHSYAPCQYRSDTVFLQGVVPVRVSANGANDKMVIQIGNALKPRSTRGLLQTAGQGKRR